MNKELTKDSITGAIFDHVEVNWGQHWMTDQDVVEDAQMREWAASQPKNWPDFAD